MLSSNVFVREGSVSSVLFSEMTPDPSWEPDFNDWYDREHIPLRMAVPGFRSAQRYRVAGEPHYLAVYEIDDLAVLTTPGYQRIKNAPSDRTRRMLGGVRDFTRYLADTIGEQSRPGAGDEWREAPILYAVFFTVPAARQPEFEDWYERDHVPALLECPDWLAARRLRIVDGEPADWTHLTLHYLADRRALDSPERARARTTPWRTRLAQESWFNGLYLVFEKHGARQRPTP
jgi:hypothetical protein